MPLRKGKGKQTINENTKTLIEEGYPPRQAYAISNSKARRTRKAPEKPKKKGLLRRLLGR